MKKLILIAICSLFLMGGCVKGYKYGDVEYEIDCSVDNDNDPRVFRLRFYERDNIYFMQLENDSNSHRLILTDTLKKRTYQFISSVPFQIDRTDIPIKMEQYKQRQ